MEGATAHDGGDSSITAFRRWSHVAVVMAFWAVFVALGVGLVSSNDGSHVALARALATRGEPELASDVGLTLMVDRARREGRDYSDRPPGTAVLAIPAMWIGDGLDGWLARRSQATGALVLVPAGWPYLQTYAARVPDGPPLFRRQGTALMARIQAATVGAAALWLLLLLLGWGRHSERAKWFAVGGLGLASLWGPYSTTLFSHGTAGLSLLGLVAALEAHRIRPRAWLAVAAGACGAFAVAADYALLVAVVPLTLALAPRPRPWWVAVGILPVALMVGAYHQAAFGSPWSIGYDHHHNFQFARARLSTFDGNPLRGLWVLWGAGHGAGVLALAPVMLAGVVGLWREQRRVLLALVPWLVLLCFHHTPWGGAGTDHRYLVPVMPLLAVGLARSWDDAASRRPIRIGLVVLAIYSAVASWSHFLAWSRG